MADLPAVARRSKRMREAHAIALETLCDWGEGEDEARRIVDDLIERLAGVILGPNRKVRGRVQAMKEGRADG